MIKTFILFLLITCSLSLYNEDDDDNHLKYILDLFNQDINLNDFVYATKDTVPDLLQYLKYKTQQCTNMYKCNKFLNEINKSYKKLRELIKLYEQDRADKFIFTDLDLNNVFANAQRRALERLFEDMEYSRLYKELTEMKLSDMPEMKIFLEEYCTKFNCEFIKN